MGVVIGVFSHGIISMLLPTLKTFTGLDFGSLKIWHLIAFWVAAFNFKPYLNRNKPDAKIEAAIDQIKRMESSGQITKSQAKVHYHNLSLRVLESVTLSGSASSARGTSSNS